MITAEFDEMRFFTNLTWRYFFEQPEISIRCISKEVFTQYKHLKRTFS